MRIAWGFMCTLCVCVCVFLFTFPFLLFLNTLAAQNVRSSHTRSTDADDDDVLWRQTNVLGKQRFFVQTHTHVTTSIFSLLLSIDMSRVGFCYWHSKCVPYLCDATIHAKSRIFHFELNQMMLFQFNEHRWLKCIPNHCLNAQIVVWWLEVRVAHGTANKCHHHLILQSSWWKYAQA